MYSYSLLTTVESVHNIVAKISPITHAHRKFELSPFESSAVLCGSHSIPADGALRVGRCHGDKEQESCQ